MDTNKTNAPEFNQEDDRIVLTMEDGTERAFNYEDSFIYKDKKYLCLSPAEEMNEISEGELLIYELKENEQDDEGMLTPIEDEALLEEVYKEYCKRYDEEFEEGCECEGECDCGCCGEGECDCED
jgi:uncharacterized protein YrzB (UPF0473 family)